MNSFWHIPMERNSLSEADLKERPIQREFSKLYFREAEGSLAKIFFGEKELQIG